MKIVIVLAAFVRRAFLEGAAARASWLLNFLGFAAGAASLYFLARLVDASPNPHLANAGGYTGFLLLGLIAADVQRTATSSLATRIREAQLQGTLEAMLAAPAPAWLVLAGVGLPDLLASVARAATYLALAPLAATGFFARTNLTAALVAAFLASLAFGALGLLGAALTLIFRRGNPLGTFVGGLSLVAGGVMYPSSVLPGWLQTLGAFLPVSPALEALRGSILDGKSLTELTLAASGTSPLLRLIGFSVVTAPLSAALFAWALSRARADGSLSSY